MLISLRDVDVQIPLGILIVHGCFHIDIHSTHGIYQLLESLRVNGYIVMDSYPQELFYRLFQKTDTPISVGIVQPLRLPLHARQLHQGKPWNVDNADSTILMAEAE